MNTSDVFDNLPQLEQKERGINYRKMLKLLSLFSLHYNYVKNQKIRHS